VSKYVTSLNYGGAASAIEKSAKATKRVITPTDA
jgi:hypothetical protein